MLKYKTPAGRQSEGSFTAQYSYIQPFPVPYPSYTV
jgi:hypothetical protein